MTEQAQGFRVYIDGDPQAHHSAQGVRVVLRDGEDVAEVQVAKVGSDIVVVAAGLWGHTVNDRGHLLVSVAPTPGKHSGPESEADWYGHAAHPEVRG